MLTSDDLLFITPGTHYCSHSVSLPTEIISIFFEAELPEETENNIFNNLFVKNKCELSIKNTIKEINRIFLLNHPIYKIAIKKELYKILKILLDKMYIDEHNSYGDYYIIQKADKYIKDNYLKEDISIGYLADLCKITPAYFSRIFKNVYGISPKKYIIGLKMQSACEYLSSTLTPVKEIAHILGYNEDTYFVNAFKKYHGIYPLEYRKSHSNI